MHDRGECKDELGAFLHQRSVLSRIVIRHHWKVAWSVYRWCGYNIWIKKGIKVRTNLCHYGIIMNMPLDMVACVVFKNLMEIYKMCGYKNQASAPWRRGLYQLYRLSSRVERRRIKYPVWSIEAYRSTTPQFSVHIANKERRKTRTTGTLVMSP